MNSIINKNTDIDTDKIKLFMKWFILTVLASLSSQLSLFLQTTEGFKNAPYAEILLTTEFWASLQWAFALPAFRLGTQLLSAPQIYLAGYLIGFATQIFSSFFIFKSKITVDDYVTILIMLSALIISKFKLVG